MPLIDGSRNVMSSIPCLEIIMKLLSYPIQFFVQHLPNNFVDNI